jgi:hypothetical protein
MHLSLMGAKFKKAAVLLKAEIYWPRPERVAHRTADIVPNREGGIFIFAGQRKLMNTSWSIDYRAA